jgi:hypothetical protein
MGAERIELGQQLHRRNQSPAAGVIERIFEFVGLQDARKVDDRPGRRRHADAVPDGDVAPS